MRRLLLALGAAGALLSSGAYAADMPVKGPAVVPMAVPYSWTGFYAGADGGELWGKTHTLQLDTVPPFPSDGKIRLPAYGLHGGYQYQFQHWVIGLEASSSVAVGDNGVNNYGPCVNPAFSCGISKITNIFTAGGRLGWAWDRWLLAVSGGWATARIERGAAMNLTTFAPDVTTITPLVRHDGAYAGVGFDWMVARFQNVDLIFGTEYRHIWLDNKQQVTVTGTPFNIKADVNQIRSRFDLKFNP